MGCSPKAYGYLVVLTCAKGCSPSSTCPDRAGREVVPIRVEWFCVLLCLGCSPICGCMLCPDQGRGTNIRMQNMAQLYLLLLLYRWLILYRFCVV